MCGLVGFLQSPDAAELRLCQHARRMADTLSHRGPDDAGVWADATAGLALGFRRLAILDLSPTGHQPMCSSDGRYVGVFNGEIYNYRDLRVELEQCGAHFRGTSDTEVIVEGASQWGVEATIPRLWGMFAIALWDRQQRTLFLIRDRVGKKPLYYAQMREVFLFGSELKALRAHPAFRAEVNRDALAAYLRYGYIPAPYSIYHRVYKLLPGSYVVVRLGQPPVIHPYWEARRVVESGRGNRLIMSDGEAIEGLDTLLRDAVARRMIADVPLGALLSGGVDSSTVVALMQAQSSRPIKTFTIGFHIPAYNEAEAAKAIARHLGTDHTEWYITPAETQAVIPRLPHLFDEPFADSSQIPTFLVCALARQHVTVSLSGDGGDELFHGYTRYMRAEHIWARMSLLPVALRGLFASVIRPGSPRRRDTLYARLAPMLPARVRQSFPSEKLAQLGELLQAGHPDGLYQYLVSLWKTPDDVVVDGHEAATLLTDPTVRQSVPDFTERMMLLDLVTYLPDDILVKVDRASMGVSLEARAPLLDHRLVEWAWQLPLRFKARKHQHKWLLRQVLYRYVPPALVERPKMGFAVPIGAWLRGPLRDWAEALLDAHRLRQEGFLRPEPIRKVWAAHLSGPRNEQSRLWAVLMFQAWLEQWSQS
jgi:asparagine synthase (glutamine-hydrolysing)